jgi:hypothetical protein
MCSFGPKPVDINIDVISSNFDREKMAWRLDHKIRSAPMRVA